MTELQTDRLQQLSSDYWDWRAAEQPQSDDDIPRLERPEGWHSDWSEPAVAEYRAYLDAFEARLAAIPVPDAENDDPEVRRFVVDHALVGSGIARARFELDTTQMWCRDPMFTVDQSIGVVFTLLRAPVGFDGERVETIITALEDMPSVLQQGLVNLAGHATTEFTELAKATLDGAAGVGADESLRLATAALAQQVPEVYAQRVVTAGEVAAAALAEFRTGLNSLATTAWSPIGRDGFVKFLRTVALNPLAPEQLLLIGNLERERAEAFSVIASRGHRIDSGRSEPRDPLPTDMDAIVERQHGQELEIRAFYETHGILTQPSTLRHYLLETMPDYLQPLQWLGVTDDIGWETADRDAVSYQPDSSEALGFFDDAIARDPMTQLIHEGAHSQQIALSAKHPDAIRRHYYDSGANEGIGYYNEEMLDAAGLFAGNANSEETMHAFLRLRSLRVSIDISLALGLITIAEAADRLARQVPMDRATAEWEASFFAKTPGQGMTYQIGKTQIIGFLAAAAHEPGFVLQEFHDRLWLNGNVPIALQRYELLGDVEQLRDLVL